MAASITSNGLQVAGDLRRLSAGARQRVHRAVVESGAKLQAAVKRHANEPRSTPRPGPGGPRLLTGDYNRSISRLSTQTATGSTSVVSSSRPQAKRLEFGFTGTDALGRSVDQKAYPHFGPALDEIAPVFEAAIADALTPEP